MGTSSNFGNMLSMALASSSLPFLPLTPVQILLNNLLYDLSEIGIPFDRVEPSEIARPRAWDMGETPAVHGRDGQRCPRVFDIATFAILVFGFAAHAGAVPDGLVPRVDRDANPGDLHHSHRMHAAWLSRPDPVLVATSLTRAGGRANPCLFADWDKLGFVAVPGALIATIAVIVVAYLAAAEIAKRAADRPRAGTRVADGTRRSRS